MEDLKSPDPWSKWSDVVVVCALVGMSCSEAFPFRYVYVHLIYWIGCALFFAFVFVSVWYASMQCRGACTQRCGASAYYHGIGFSCCALVFRLMMERFHEVLWSSPVWSFSLLGLGQQNRTSLKRSFWYCLNLEETLGNPFLNPSSGMFTRCYRKTSAQFVHAQISTSSRTSFHGQFWSTPSFPPSFVPAVAWTA